MSKWPLLPICSLGIVTTGSTPKTSEEHFYGGEIPFVTPAELDQIAPVTTSSRTLSETGALEARLLSEGTVMVCCIGSLGKVGIAGCTLATNQQINSIEFDKKSVWPRFGFYACRLLKSKLETMAPATTVAIVNKSKFEQLKIPVPPLPEQQRIAAILDITEKLKFMRRATLSKLDSLIQAIFVEMFGDPGTNGKNWPRKSLKDLGKVATGGTPPSAKTGMFGGPIPFVTPGDLENDAIVKRSLTDVGATESVTVRSGATLVCCIGATIGKIAMARERSAFNQQINSVEWTDEVDDLYGFHVLRFFKPTIIAWGTSTTLPILKKSSFERIEIPVPPISLQLKFAQRAKSIESLRKTHKQSLDQMGELFFTLQQRAFKGDL